MNTLDQIIDAIALGFALLGLALLVRIIICSHRAVRDIDRVLKDLE